MEVSVLEARALGIRVNDPKLAKAALAAMSGSFAPPKDTDGFGAASFVDDVFLLKRVPSAPPDGRFDDVMGSLKGPCSLLQFRTAAELRPAKQLNSHANLGPFRFKGYAAAIIGGPQNADEASASREALLQGMPDSLLRSATGNSEAEAFFLRLLAEGQKKGFLEHHQDGNWILPIVSEVASMSKCSRAILFATGREMALVSYGMPSCLISVDGLCGDAERHAERERQRCFRGAFLFAGLPTPCPRELPLPAGMTVRSFPEDTALVLEKN